MNLKAHDSQFIGSNSLALIISWFQTFPSPKRRRSGVMVHRGQMLESPPKRAPASGVIKGIAQYYYPSERQRAGSYFIEGQKFQLSEYILFQYRRRFPVNYTTSQHCVSRGVRYHLTIQTKNHTCSAYENLINSCVRCLGMPYHLSFP